MLAELMSLSERKRSAFPELVRFFETTGGAAWETQLEAFLRIFTGATLDIPGPEFLKALRRDQAIAKSLSADAGASNVLRLMEAHSVDLNTIRAIYAATSGRTLQPCSLPGPRQATIDACTEMLRASPERSMDIIQLYALNSTEAAAARDAAGMRVSEEPHKDVSGVHKAQPLSEPQKKILRALERSQKPLSIRDIQRRLKIIAKPTKTINGLKKRRWVRGGDRISITPAGRAAIKNAKRGRRGK